MNAARASITEVVALPEWQALRASFIGTWRKTPDENVAKLRAFLGMKPWEPRRIRIVLNYLTGSGFRLHVIGCRAADELRREVREAWAPIRGSRL